MPDLLLDASLERVLSREAMPLVNKRVRKSHVAHLRISRSGRASELATLLYRRCGLRYGLSFDGSSHQGLRPYLRPYLLCKKGSEVTGDQRVQFGHETGSF